jgi:hypothetical protein
MSYYLAGKVSRKVFKRTKATPFVIHVEKDIKLVVTGTSLGSAEESLDKQLVVWAKANRIPVISIIEHWSWYRKRFEVDNSELLLPDYILVNDTIALQDAIAEGLPASMLYAMGNPYLEQLCTNQLEHCESEIILKQYSLPADKQLLFFISEALKDTFKVGTGDYMGYDEFEVLDSIVSQLRENEHLVIKLHPEESASKYDRFRCESVSILRECPVKDLSAIAYKIIGMASMLLLELTVFRKDIISYRPNASKDFIGERLGLTIPAKDAFELRYFLDQNIYAKQNLSEYFQGSKNRIINFILSIQK